MVTSASPRLFTVDIGIPNLKIFRGGITFNINHGHPESPLYVHRFIIVLKLRLATEDHKKELLAWGICKLLPVGANLYEELLVHKVHERTEIPRIPTVARSLRERKRSLFDYSWCIYVGY